MSYLKGFQNRGPNSILTLPRHIIYYEKFEEQIVNSSYKFFSIF